MRGVLSVREWRRRREQASILIGYVMEAPRGRKREAWRIYREWQEGRMKFTEAKRRLLGLLR